MLIRRETVYKQVVEILTEVLSAITENNKKHTQLRRWISEQKKPYTKEYFMYDFIYMKSQNRQIYSGCLELQGGDGS